MGTHTQMLKYKQIILPERFGDGSEVQMGGEGVGGGWWVEV